MNFRLKLLRYLLGENNKGLTIIEGLLAIVIVTILIVAIGPVLAFAAATRIQARRVELASQAATGYLDGVRTGSILPPATRPLNLGEIPSQVLAGINAPPASSLTCDTAYGYCASPSSSDYNLYCVDRNGNGNCSLGNNNNKDFVIQASRVGPIPNNSGFLLGIRVYRVDAFGAGLTLLRKGENRPGNKSNVIAGGSGNRVAPVVEMTTEISASQ